MTKPTGAGRRTGPPGLRRRVRNLYRVKRARLLEVPTAALRRRYGDAVEVDDADHHFARVKPTSGPEVEVGFAGKYRMFGALIDTQWVTRRGTIGETHRQEFDYRFDLEKFVVKKGDNQALAARLGDDLTKKLAKQAELKRIRVLEFEQGRQVEITPLPGTITAVYLPPLPPYTVPMKPAEADAQLTLLLHLVEHG